MWLGATILDTAVLDGTCKPSLEGKNLTLYNLLSATVFLQTVIELIMLIYVPVFPTSL